MDEDERLRALMVRYQGGDRDAFLEIYSHLAADVRRYLRYLARDLDRADDLLQETFMQLHRSRALYNPALPVRPWVFGVTRRVFLMERRARQRRMTHLEYRDVLPEVPVPADLERLGNDRGLQRALSTVPPDRVEAVLLHHVWGFTFTEIAGMLGIRPAAARARASRGMSDLRRALLEPVGATS